MRSGWADLYPPPWSTSTSVDRLLQRPGLMLQGAVLSGPHRSSHAADDGIWQGRSSHMPGQSSRGEGEDLGEWSARGWAGDGWGGEASTVCGQVGADSVVLGVCVMRGACPCPVTAAVAAEANFPRFMTFHIFRVPVRQR